MAAVTPGLPSPDPRECFQDKLDRISQDDPKETVFTMDAFGEFRWDHDDVIALVHALQKSTHVHRLSINVTRFPSIEACSALAEFLEMSPSLSDVSITGYNSGQPDRQLTQKVTEKFSSAAQNNPNIKKLCLSKTDLTARALKNFFSSSSLSNLTLSELGNITQSSSSSDLSSMARTLSQCQTLQQVSLEDVVVEFMIPILQEGLPYHPSLQFLSVLIRRERDITSIADPLGKLLYSNPPHLKTLQFFCSCFCQGTMYPIVRGLLHNSTLQVLRFRECKFESDTEGRPSNAIPALRSLLESSMSPIVELDLTGSRVSLQLNQILSSIHSKTSIRRLNLSSCHLQATSSLTHLTTFLHRKNYIEYLNLSENGITLQGIQSLASCLRHPTTQIRSLVLDRNLLQDDGAVAVAEMLRSNAPSSLTELSLGRCYINAAGAQAILEALPHNHTLKILKILGVRYWYYREEYLDYVRATISENEPQQDIVHVTLAYNVYDTLAKVLPRCNLENLTMTVPDYNRLIGSLDEIERFQDSVLKGFADNATLKEVTLDGSLLEPSRRTQVNFYMLRNKFQPFLESQEHSEREDKFRHGTTNPRGLWAYILAAADKQCSNASALYYLLSARPDLLSPECEEDVASTASETPFRPRRPKRKHSHVSESTTRFG